MAEPSPVAREDSHHSTVSEEDVGFGERGGRTGQRQVPAAGRPDPWARFFPGPVRSPAELDELKREAKIKRMEARIEHYVLSVKPSLTGLHIAFLCFVFWFAVVTPWLEPKRFGC